MTFTKLVLTPSLDGIEVFGRAITPPHRHKRFDAWFFIKNIRTQKRLPDISDTAELARRSLVHPSSKFGNLNLHGQPK